MAMMIYSVEVVEMVVRRWLSSRAHSLLLTLGTRYAMVPSPLSLSTQIYNGLFPIPLGHPLGLW
jgi:hypothetical protein